jgi:hypothetical protein
VVVVVVVAVIIAVAVAAAVLLVVLVVVSEVIATAVVIVVVVVLCSSSSNNIAVAVAALLLLLLLVVVLVVVTTRQCESNQCSFWSTHSNAKAVFLKSCCVAGLAKLRPGGRMRSQRKVVAPIVIRMASVTHCNRYNIVNLQQVIWQVC